MTFTEAQQTEIVKVVSTNEFTKGTFADTIESLRASLDAGTITQEQYNEQEEDLALKLYDTSLSQISEEEKSAVETAGSLVGQQLNVAKPATEQKEVLEGGLYTYFDILKESSAYTKMLPFVAPGVTDAKEQDRLMKEWCDKIGGIWRSYVTGSIEDPELFAKSPEAAENIVHGMSFYFTEWLSNDANDKEIKSVVNASAGITSDTGLAGLTNKLFGLFKGLTSFQTQMQRVTAAAGLINKHSDPLNTVDDDTKKVKINTMPIFTSPHGFYDWLAHSSSLFPAVPNATPPSFAEAFEYSITATKENMTTVMDNLDYDETTHKLMESVLTTGKIVLDKRGEARSMVKEIYDQVAMITGVFGSGSVSETLDSRGLKGIADFVCLVLGFGGLEGMEKSYFKKAFDKNLPSESLPGLQQALAYAKHYLSDSDSPYGPTTHEDKGSVLSQNGLSKAFDTFDYSKHKVGEAIPTKTDLLSLVPTSPALLEDGLEHALQSSDGFLPHPVVLNQIGMKKHLINDKGGKLIINPGHKEELKKALNTDKVRTKLISLACQNILTPDAMVGLAKKGCTQQDTLALIYGFLIAPLDTVKAVQYDLLDGDTLGNDIEITAMVGHGNELAASKAEEAKETAKQKVIDDAEKAWNDAKVERDKAVEELGKVEKGGTDDEKKEATDAVVKAKAKVVETKKKLDEAKRDPKESDKPADDGLGSTDGIPNAVGTGTEVAIGFASNSEANKEREKVYDTDQKREILPDPKNRYTPEFAQKVVAISARLGNLDPNWIMNIMEKESAHTFSPSIKNGKGSGATGLIQFMPDGPGKDYKTIGGEQVKISALEKMTAIEQLDYVEKYFQPYKGKLNSLAATYTAVFYPMHLNYVSGDSDHKNMDKIIFQAGTEGYRQNQGMDTTNKGNITVQDVIDFVTKGQKVYFKPIEKTPERNSEIQKPSIDLAEKSVYPSKTVLFGASNAGTMAGVIADTSSRKGVHSFPAESSSVLRQKADDMTARGEIAIITSTVNNTYSTEEQAKNAAEDIQAIAQKAIASKSQPVIVLYPDPTNRSDKATSPNRYASFQRYNQMMREWCEKYAGPIKPQVLDLTISPNKEKFKRDNTGYHVDPGALKEMVDHYIAK